MSLKKFSMDILFWVFWSIGRKKSFRNFRISWYAQVASTKSCSFTNQFWFSRSLLRTIMKERSCSRALGFSTMSSTQKFQWAWIRLHFLRKYLSSNKRAQSKSFLKEYLSIQKVTSFTTQSWRASAWKNQKNVWNSQLNFSATTPTLRRQTNQTSRLMWKIRDFLSLQIISWKQSK